MDWIITLTIDYRVWLRGQECQQSPSGGRRQAKSGFICRVTINYHHAFSLESQRQKTGVESMQCNWINSVKPERAPSELLLHNISLYYM
jgi:hypothetical protein